MPTLDWIGKSAVKDHHKTIPYHLLEKDEKLSIGNTKNMLIQGDNLLALKSLLPYYKNKIKCVYIDPPYNTGNESWIYNDKVNSPTIQRWIDKVVGKPDEDLSMHDKWLCMMYPRLSLLRELMSDDGVIFISIDDNEQAHLKILCDEIFGARNFIAELVWKKKYTGGKHSNHFVDLHEYILVFGKNKSKVTEFLIPRPEKDKSKFVYDDEFINSRGRYYIRPLKSNLESRPTLVYPIKLPDGKEIKTQWLVAKPKFKELLKDKRILFKKKQNGEYQVYKKYYEFDNDGKIKFDSIIDNTSNNDAKSEIKKLFNIKEGRDVPFYTVKPVKLIHDLVLASTSHNDIILDSFVGSGTTAQTVMELNKKDKGSRKFILIEMDPNVVRSVTHKRLDIVTKKLKAETAPPPRQ